MYHRIKLNNVPTIISSLCTILLCGFSLLLNACASEPSKFEQQNRWLEKNYPNAKMTKQKKQRKSPSNTSLIESPANEITPK